MAEAVLRFSYHRSIAPMMWVFVGLATIELLVVHFLLALWNSTVAASASALSLVGLVWLFRAIASFRALPVLLFEDRVVMRVGRLRSIELPLESISTLRQDWAADDLKPRSVLNLALIAYPNILIDLREPIAGRRLIAAVAHRLDDPIAFRSALEAKLRAYRPTQSATCAAT